MFIVHRKDALADLTVIILANLAPVSGVALYHWELEKVLYFFWIQLIILGLFDLLRIGKCSGRENVFDREMLPQSNSVSSFGRELLLISVYGILLFMYKALLDSLSFGFPQFFSAEVFWIQAPFIISTVIAYYIFDSTEQYLTISAGKQLFISLAEIVPMLIAIWTVFINLIFGGAVELSTVVLLFGGKMIMDLLLYVVINTEGRMLK